MVTRRSVELCARWGTKMFDASEKPSRDSQLPPAPDWRPATQQPLDRIIDRLQYYTEGKRDFAVFQNGTCVILPDGLSEADANAAATDVLMKIFRFHADMSPRNMDDGNILIQYNHPA